MSVGFQDLSVGLWWGLGGAYITVNLTTGTLKAVLPHGCMNWCILPTKVSRVTAESAVACQWNVRLPRPKQTKPMQCISQSRESSGLAIGEVLLQVEEQQFAPAE